MLRSNRAALKSWLFVPPDCDFPIQNLPFGIFKTDHRPPRAGVAIGDFVLDLAFLHEHGFFDAVRLPPDVFNQPTLNNFMTLGKTRGREVRDRISELLQHDHDELRSDAAARETSLIPKAEVQMLLPLQIRNYTDFYSSEQHAVNVGSLFRDPKNALLPNWKHMPVAYHGRASSIVVSGTPLHRPKGQRKPNDSELPVFGPTQKLDFELELAFVTCVDTPLGSPISTSDADDHIFGFVLFNDWSARDIQQWEYVPLGPFLGKNFGSTMSPWVVTMDALEPFRIKGPAQDPPVLDYLYIDGERNFDITLEVWLKPAHASAPTLLCRSNAAHLYWNINQQLAHQTVNGCNIAVGDLYASGTISGPTPQSSGSLLELTVNGRNPLHLDDGNRRTFLEDGDEILLKGFAIKEGVRIGFGECIGSILPATP